VQVLTPRLDFNGCVGVGQLVGLSGVCANDAIVVVSEWGPDRISVFARCDGALVRRFGSQGCGDGRLPVSCPRGLCFMSGHRHVAVADYGNNHVSVFSVEGEFVRHVAGGELHGPSGVARSAFDELVVVDYGNVVVFSASATSCCTRWDPVTSPALRCTGTATPSSPKTTPTPSASATIRPKTSAWLAAACFL
jgi:hypothetical protein